MTLATTLPIAILQQSSPSAVPAWIMFLILALVCLLIGLMRLAAPSSKSGVASTSSLSGVTAMAPIETSEGDFALTRSPNDTLKVWDEAAVTRQLDGLRGQSPAVLTHYVDSVKSRWVTNQNDKTAAVRAKFLKTKLEELKLFKEGQQIMVDLEALVLEREKRLKTLQLENAQLDATMRTRSEHEQLEARKKSKQLELEIARIEKEIRDLNTPPMSEAKPTPEQERAQRKAACEARIANLRKEQQEAVQAIPADLPEQRRKVSNMYADAIEREMDNLRKVL